MVLSALERFGPEMTIAAAALLLLLQRALQTVADGEAGLSSLVVSAEEDKGRYTFRFHKASEGWVEVTVDDQIPLNHQGMPLFASASDPGVTWPLLFEKAFAKLHTSYASLNGGAEVDALADLTGPTAAVVVRELTPEQGQAEQSPDQGEGLFSSLMDEVASGGFVGCSLVNLEDGSASNNAMDPGELPVARSAV